MLQNLSREDRLGVVLTALLAGLAGFVVGQATGAPLVEVDIIEGWL